MPEQARVRALRKVFAVARHEFISTVTRVGYLVTLVGMPLFIGALSAISGIITSRAAALELAQARTIGLVDESGLFAAAPLTVLPDVNLDRLPQMMKGAQALVQARIELRRYGSLEAARAALLSGEVTSIAYFRRDYLATGKVDTYRGSRRGLDLVGRSLSVRALRGWMTTALLAGRLDAALAARVARPADERSWVIEPDGSIAEQDLLAELRPFLVPMGFAVLLLLSIFTSASYLATGLAEEKQNRALEMMLTSLTPEQLFWGKLLGLWLAALLQFVLYLGLVGAPAAFLYAALGLHIGQALIAFAYFVLGFFFYGAVLLTVGAIGNTQKYTQQLSGAFTFMAVIPMMVMPALLSRPSGAVARLLTYIPFTAPITGMLRSGAGALPWWEFLLSLASLALGAFMVVRACAKIFRVALLATGNQPGPAQLWKWLRE